MYFMSFVMLLLLGGAAAIDFGGRKAAGFATGLIDACQYLGGGLFAGSIIGALMQSYGTVPGTDNITPEGWRAWIVVLMGFTLIGGVLMSLLWNTKPERGRP